MIPKANADLFWQSVHAGAVNSSWENNVDIVWDGPANETEIAEEMQIVETMINRHVDAIGVAPSDRSSFKIVIDRATAAGIPVVVFDSGVDTTNYVTFVATDNYAAGELAGERMGKLLKGKGRIVIVATNPGGASTVAREDGFKHTLTGKYPNIHILDERFGMSSIAISRTVAENMLTAHPDLDGIFCSNESGSEGAVSALLSRGSKVKLVGFDSSPMLLDEVKAGHIDSLVIQDPFRMGKTVVDAAVQSLKGQTLPKKTALPARLVDASNINDPDVQQQVHPDLAKYLRQ